MRIRGLGKAKKIYFIGIGGVSMSALAKFLSVCGYEVSGSDGVKGEWAEKLASYGVKIFIGIDANRAELLSADAVIYTDAIAENHEELQKAKELDIPLLRRAELLRIISEEFPNVLAVAGSHGKTTCASMCAHVFQQTRVGFTAHIGGEDSVFGNYISTGYEYFLTEACEYKKNLLNLRPTVGILLNIDKDHMECYRDEKELLQCFQTYCKNSQTAFLCADNEKCRSIGDFPSFGITNKLADYRATDIQVHAERYAFMVEEYGKPLCRVKLNALGKCNIYNALAAFAARRSFGFNEKEIAKGLETFTAVKRRFEKIGYFQGVKCICDYAHHPREIESTVKTAENICRGQLYVVFQPHTYSRTKLLMNEFVNVFREIHHVMIYKTFAAREKYEEEGSAKRLAEEIGDCLYAENIYALKTWLKKTVKEGDLILFLGAGDIYYVAQYLLKELK